MVYPKNSVFTLRCDLVVEHSLLHNDPGVHNPVSAIAIFHARSERAV